MPGQPAQTHTPTMQSRTGRGNGEAQTLALDGAAEVGGDGVCGRSLGCGGEEEERRKSAVQQGQAEGRGLAGTRLGLTHQIPTEQQLRDGGLLNRRRRLKTQIGKTPQQFRPQPETLERRGRVWGGSHRRGNLDLQGGLQITPHIGSCDIRDHRTLGIAFDRSIDRGSERNRVRSGILAGQAELYIHLRGWARRGLGDEAGNGIAHGLGEQGCDLVSPLTQADNNPMEPEC